MEEFKNVKVIFGLEAQGHLSTIEAEIARYDRFLEPGEKRHMLYSYNVWEDIGRKIGWQPLAAAMSYFEYLENLPKEIYITQDKLDGEIYCAFENKEIGLKEAEESGTLLKTIRLC